MKILTGYLRGRTILFKPNSHLRPTSDKTRKAIFDMLQGALENKRVLDLFSGTGALGLEALSQGAKHVTFVEQDVFQHRKIMKNLESLKLRFSATVSGDEALGWIEREGPRQGPFDFVFLDPPYASDLALKTLESISRAQIVAPGGFVILECRKEEEVPANTALFDADTGPGLERYVAQCAIADERLRVRINALADSKRPILVWGVGTHTTRLMATSRLPEANIVAFIESNVRYHGKTLHDHPILAPEALCRYAEPVLISSRVFQHEIAEQIRRDLGCANELILLYDV